MSIEDKLVDILKEGDKVFILRDTCNANKDIHNIVVAGRVSKIIDRGYNGRITLDPYIVSSVNGEIYFTNNDNNVPSQYECNLDEQGLCLTKDFNKHLSVLKKEIELNGKKETDKNKLYFSTAPKI